MLSLKSFVEEFEGPNGVLQYLDTQGLGIDYSGGVSHPDQLQRTLHSIDTDKIVAMESNASEKPLVFVNGSKFIDTVSKVEKKYKYRLFDQ